ncbi:MAG TPA: LysR substrate-binding domain-containing protein [Pseudomonadales bacterium]|nr:LysR substrate-binding domain-containing protein [Pseudomonadales bacterium]
MDLALLRSLLAVTDAGAITEAASRLGITQPALTRRIQHLEQEFGAELLSRSRKGAQLTELGRLVEQEARVLVDRYDSLKAEVASHSTVEGGTVRIGGGATAVSFVLPDAIAQFQRDFPRVHFHVKEASSSEIASDVANGRLELGLVTQPVRTAGLEIRPLLDDRIVLVAARDNPLSSMPAVSVSDLDGRNFVGFEGGSAIRQIVDASLREAGVEINVVMELRSIPAIVRMVATTGSLAFVSQLGLHGQDLVREIDVRGLVITRRLALAWRKASSLSPAALRFAERLARTEA